MTSLAKLHNSSQACLSVDRQDMNIRQPSDNISDIKIAGHQIKQQIRFVWDIIEFQSQEFDSGRYFSVCACSPSLQNLLKSKVVPNALNLSL